MLNSMVWGDTHSNNLFEFLEMRWASVMHIPHEGRRRRMMGMGERKRYSWQGREVGREVKR